jgi:F0F1-type ATP synthase delta subunit
MSSNKHVGSYSRTLFRGVKYAEENKEAFELANMTALGQKPFVPDIFIVGEELLLIRASIVASKGMKDFFRNPTYAEKIKLDILLTIFPGVTVITKAFLKVLTDRSHLSLLPEISDEFNAALLKFKSTTKVKLITSNMLPKRSGLALLKKLRILTNSKDIILSLCYQKRLIGGLVLEYNSLALDTSLFKEFSLLFDEV